MNKIIFFSILTQLAIVSYFDIKTQKISNYWSVLNGALAILLYIFLPQIYPFEFEIFIFPLLTIFIGFVLYLLNIMGAGDSKYLATLFLIMPADNHFLYFEKLVASTLVVGAMYLTWTIIKSYSDLKGHFYAGNWRQILVMIRSSFSYAPVMLVAWILLGMQKWF